LVPLFYHIQKVKKEVVLVYYAIVEVVRSQLALLEEFEQIINLYRHLEIFVDLLFEEFATGQNLFRHTDRVPFLVLFQISFSNCDLQGTSLASLVHYLALLGFLNIRAAVLQSQFLFFYFLSTGADKIFPTNNLGDL
jgi:hypothetical protein